jgi:hypothetical protein
MTREEKIQIVSVENADKRLTEIANLNFAISAKADYYNGLTQGFKDGANWADNNPRMFKGQTEKMEEREIAFMDWWLENHKGKLPTFADAIAWADKTMVEKTCEWLKDNMDLEHDYPNSNEELIEDLKKAMEE